MMIKTEYLGHVARIIDMDGRIWSGKVVELEGPEESDSGKIELGIDYAGGITMFTESEIIELRILDEDVCPGSSEQAAGTLYKQFERVKLKDGRIGTVMDHAGPDYVVDVGESEKDYDTILVKPEEIEKIK